MKKNIFLHIFEYLFIQHVKSNGEGEVEGRGSCKGGKEGEGKEGEGKEIDKGNGKVKEKESGEKERDREGKGKG